MSMIPFLIGFPVLLAAILFLIRKEDLRGYMVYAGAGVIMLITVIFIMQWIFDGSETWMLYPSTELPDHLIAAGDIFLMGLILYMSLKYKRPLPAILSIVQTVLQRLQKVPILWWTGLRSSCASSSPLSAVLSVFIP